MRQFGTGAESASESDLGSSGMFRLPPFPVLLAILLVPFAPIAMARQAGEDSGLWATAKAEITPGNAQNAGKKLSALCLRRRGKRRRNKDRAKPFSVAHAVPLLCVLLPALSGEIFCDERIVRLRPTTARQEQLTTHARINFPPDPNQRKGVVPPIKD